MENLPGETNSHDAMLKALQRLKRVRKLEGTVVTKDGDCLSAETLLGERQLNDFVLQIKALLAQYRNSGSPLNRALFNFDGGCFLLFNLSSYVFCFFFGESDDAAVIEKAGEEFLEEWKDSLKVESSAVVALPELKIEVAPQESGGDSVDSDSHEVEDSDTVGSMLVPFDPLDPESCHLHFRAEVKSLFVNVLSATQVSQILDPEWKAIKSIPYDSRKDPPEKDFGKSLISRVRDRRIRKQLIAAHDDLVLSHYGQKRGASSL